MAILIGILVSLVVGILPMVVYAMILWWFDRYEKEPIPLLIAAFLWGAVPSIIFSLIAQLLFHGPAGAFEVPADVFPLVFEVAVSHRSARTNRRNASPRAMTSSGSVRRKVKVALARGSLKCPTLT